LKIETQLQDDHQMKVVAEFEAALLEKYMHKAARKYSERAKVPGFRPGKAPYDVILRLYGEEAILDEAKGLLVEENYPAILDEAKIQPAAAGSLLEISEGDPIKATFMIPLEPTVELGDYKSLRKKYSPKAVAEKQVDEYIERMRKNYATAEPADHPAAKGDLVYLKLDATLTKPVDDEKPEVLKDSPIQVVIGENDPEMNDFPYPGFGDALAGLSEKGEKTFKYTYPEDSKYDRLRGKEVEFHAVVESVKTLHLPELNDEFAQSLGDFETMDKVREMVRKQLEAQAKADYDQTFFEELYEKIVKDSKVKYAPQTLEHEMEHVVESIEHDLSHQHMELDTYLKTLKKEKAAWMEEEIKPAAIKRLERSLVLEELAKVEKIEVKNEDLQEEFKSMVSQMQYGMDIKKLQKQLKSEQFTSAVAMEAATRLLNRNLQERLKDIATGKAEETKAAEVATEEKPAKAKKTAEKAAEGEKEAAAPKKTAKKTAEAVAEDKKPVKKTAKKAAETSEAAKSDKK
jgi:trigger factor